MITNVTVIATVRNVLVFRLQVFFHCVYKMMEDWKMEDVFVVAFGKSFAVSCTHFFRRSMNP